MNNTHNEELRETMIETLVEDYYQYLLDFTLEEIQLIITEGVFTLSKAREERK